MGEQIKLDYYYGDEPDKFCFYRIPKVLFTKAFFAELSTDAKVLYGLMLDMMASSRSNRWMDQENRVFILFSIQRAMAYLDCGKDKAIKLFAELDTEKGIGLIERTSRGQGRADLIYVKSFEIPDDAEDNARIQKLRKKKQEAASGPSVQKLEDGRAVDNHLEAVGKTDRAENPPAPPPQEVVGKADRAENPPAPLPQGVVGKADRAENPAALPPQEAVGKTDRSDFPASRGLDFRFQEVGFPDANNTDYSNTDSGGMHPVLSCLVRRETEEAGGHMDYSRPLRITQDQPGQDRDRQGRRDLKAAYLEILKNQVRYGELMSESHYRFDREKIDGILNMIADLAATEPPDGIEWINSRPYSHEVVKGRLLKVDYDILTYVLGRMSENTTKIHNIRSYLLTALYNAKDEISMAIASRVSHDMYGGGWEEKGIRGGGF